MTNSYPELPIVPIHSTPVTRQQLEAIIGQADATKEVKRMVLVMLRNESANGNKINNHNPGGIQADSGRWDDLPEEALSSVFQVAENGTGKQRLFLAFKSLLDAVTFVCNKVQSRGLYIGGTPTKIYKGAIISKPEQLCIAYLQEWVAGSSTRQPSLQEKVNFLSMYHQAEVLYV